jgi:hypothetical protein
MIGKSLIIYASITGHTQKVALRLQKAFEKKGWSCDLLKVDEKAEYRTMPSPFDCANYDFICLGSYVRGQKPSTKIIDILQGNPQSLHYFPEMAKALAEGKPVAKLPMKTHSKLIFGPDAKKGIVFVTYAGHEFGPPEAEPALSALALELEHLKYRCVGRFACPGKFGDASQSYFKNLDERPSERDLLKAGIFMEEILEEYCDCW